MDAPLLAEPAVEPKAVRLGFVAGTAAAAKLPAFERLLFRATRGNMFLRSADVGAVVDPATTERVQKAVFVVFFAGERARTKIMKICEAFGANRYPFPEEPARQRQMSAEVMARVRELGSTIDAGERLRAGLLESAAGSLEAWTVQVKREKAVYHTLNKLSVDFTRKVLVAEAWCPVGAKDAVGRALKTASDRASASVGTVFQPLMTYEAPPTYFNPGKVAGSFNDIVEAYAVARYREVNPAVLTIVTFPFLFAVMFGDVGHGILMLMVAVLLVAKEKVLSKTKLDDITAMLFGGRYVVLLMALFSIYTGFIYNEAFSIPTTVFGRGNWACVNNPDLSDRAVIAFDEHACVNATTDGLAMRPGATAYAFGIDPAWHGTRSELPFLNSLKMKMSIIMGVIQMNAGIILSYANQRYFRDSLSTYCEFIPQMVFLNGLFGYLVLLMIVKWATKSYADLYHVMIYMFLGPGQAGLVCRDPDTHNEACSQNAVLGKLQGPLQVLLVLAAVIAVPIMLIPKPLILKRRAAERAAQLASYGQVSREDPEAADDESGMHVSSGGHGEEEEEFEFGEVMVHQMIHTIEFVLGAVSNTASYLRLWALSLAHSQLSAVFFDRVLLAGMQSQNVAALFVGFFVFACATLGVLMCMESLSAFLHALRLHWVEFNNKFYHADGHKFVPFTFRVLDEEEL